MKRNLIKERKDANRNGKQKSFWNLKPFRFEGADKGELKKLSMLVDETLYTSEIWRNSENASGKGKKKVKLLEAATKEDVDWGLRGK